MAEQRIKVQRLAGGCSAEVTGIDLTRPLSVAEARPMRAAE